MMLEQKSRGMCSKACMLCSPTQFEDFFRDVTKLKQIGTIKDYQSQFEWLLTHVGKLVRAQQVALSVTLERTYEPMLNLGDQPPFSML